MPTINISAAFTLAAAIAPIYGGSNTSVSGVSSTGFIPDPASSTATWRPNFAICKGTIPGTHPTTYTARSADFLVWFADPGNTAGTMFSSSTNDNDTTTIITMPVAASASGTASWFWYWTGTSTGYSANVDKSVIGSIGGPGSGADLIISSTTITTGLQYKVIVPLKWPKLFSF